MASAAGGGGAAAAPAAGGLVARLDLNRWTALHFAAFHGHAAAAAELLWCLPRPRREMERERSAARARAETPEVCKALNLLEPWSLRGPGSEAGANFWAARVRGVTRGARSRAPVLRRACTRGARGGAALNLRDRWHRTPLAWALCQVAPPLAARARAGPAVPRRASEQPAGVGGRYKLPREITLVGGRGTLHLRRRYCGRAGHCWKTGARAAGALNSRASAASPGGRAAFARKLAGRAVGREFGKWLAVGTELGNWLAVG